MRTIQELEDEIVEDFALFSDWEDKYGYIIDLGKELEAMSEEDKSDDKLIKGCQSRVWLHANFVNGKVVFSADSDALISKGIIALLLRVLSNHRPEEILQTDLDFIDKIGLKEHLSPNRSNGLISMIKQLKLYAAAFNVKEKEKDGH